MGNRWGLGFAAAMAGVVIGFVGWRGLQKGTLGDDDRPAGPGTEAGLSALREGGQSPPRIDQRLALEAELFGDGAPGSKLKSLAAMRARGFDVDQILWHLAERDPQALIELVAAAAPSERKAFPQLGLAFATLWESDPQLAEKLAMAFPGANGRTTGLGAIVRAAIVGGGEGEAERLVAAYSEYLSEDFFQAPNLDPALVAPALAGLPDGSRSVQIVRQFVKRWMSDDRAAALRWAKTVREGELRDWALGTLLNQVAMNHVAESEAVLAAIREDVPEFVPFPTTWWMMNRARYADDPVAGVRWAVENLPASDRDHMVSELSNSVLLKHGPEEAIGILPSIPPRQRLEFEKRIAAHFGNHDPAAGIEWARGLPAGRSGEMLGALARAWVDQDLVGARAYLDAAENPPFPGLANPVAKQLAQQDPVAAVEWAKGLGAERAGDAHATAVITWSQSHSAEASAYAMTLPDGDERSRLLYVTGANLLRTDLGAGERWLSGLRSEEDQLSGRQAIMVGAPADQQERLLEQLSAAAGE